MQQLVTLEDYAYDVVRRVLADPDPWSEVFFDPSRIKDAPTDQKGQRDFCREFTAELFRLCPEWLICPLEHDPHLAVSMETSGLHEIELWNWIHIRKRLPEP